MAKVPLRKYTSQIESLIEHGQMDEAIAHCRHILKTFPKHVETYRLLGKAFLESRRHAEASDIFNRILMAVPDDFVSHVGLSIIADDQKRLQDAIWHMERAFEKQPSNAAIQAELQRLYGRRDGREPPKIRLNRGALAHMYYQGELYMQAIGEIKSVLSEDPTRTDLQGLMALSYFRAGQKAEASEVCARLLEQFPYCLDANRALVELLVGTNKATDSSIYRQRVVELDPYAAHARSSIFQTLDVPDEAVVLERLDYTGQPVEPSPDWSKSLGIGLGTAAAAAEAPEWLEKELDSTAVSAFPKDLKEGVETLRTAEESLPELPKPGVDSLKPAQPAEQDIPDWMRNAGWEESTGAQDESSASISDEIPENELAKADLPDWIKSMAPTDATPVTSESSATNEETLTWLNKLNGDKPFGSVPGSESPDQEVLGETQKTTPSDEAPDWLASLERPSHGFSTPAAAADTPAWLSDIGDTDQTSVASAAASTAEWLAKLDDEELKTSELEEDLTPAVGPAVPMPPQEKEGIGELGTSTAEQDEALLWLENLAARHGAKSEELISKPEDRLENPPEWVEQALEQVKEVPESQPSLPEPVQEEPGTEPGWSEADMTEAAASEIPEISRAGIWLNESEDKDLGREEALGEASTPMSGEIEITPPTSGKITGDEHASDLPAWLRGLEEKPSSPAARTPEDMPEWIKGEEPGESEKPGELEDLKEPEELEELEEPVAAEPTDPADWMREAEASSTPSTPMPVKPAAPKPEPKTQPKSRIKLLPKSEVAAGEDVIKIRRNDMSYSSIDPYLASAREAMSRGKIPDALQVYLDLIRKGKFLEEITFDLKEALYRFPVEVSIWQTLGDSYMRSNRLQDALDAYTKAEELLR